jgi:hypothetical protein
MKTIGLKGLWLKEGGVIKFCGEVYRLYGVGGPNYSENPRYRFTPFIMVIANKKVYDMPLLPGDIIGLLDRNGDFEFYKFKPPEWYAPFGSPVEKYRCAGKERPAGRTIGLDDTAFLEKIATRVEWPEEEE